MHDISPPHKVKERRGDCRLCYPMTQFGICFWLSLNEFSLGKMRKEVETWEDVMKEKMLTSFLTLLKRMKVGQKDTICRLPGWEVTVLDKPSEPLRTRCEFYRRFSGKQLFCKLNRPLFHHLEQHLVPCNGKGYRDSQKIKGVGFLPP